MIKLNGIFIIFIIISLFLNPESAFSKKKNQNIAKAESLIKQRKFKEARDILAKEYSTDPENEDLIIKLINKIEDEEGKVGETTEAVTRSLLNNDTKRAAELLKDLNKLKGEYSEKVKEIIKTTEIVNEQVTKLNDFYGYLEDAERNLVKREIVGVAENYNKAITIFKVTEKNSGRFNTYFLDYCNDFNLLEDKVLNSGIDLKFLKEKERFSFENIVDEYIKMVTRINEWIKIEDELMFLKKRMEKTDLISKKTIEFQSYELINFSYVDLIRNRITVYSLTLMENIFKLLERYIVEMEKGNFQNQSVVENLFDLINNKKVEKYANYNLNFNFTRDLYLKRSYLNINEFLEYITGKNNLFARSKIAKLKSIYENANKYYDTFKTNVTERELQSAEKNIKLSAGFIDSLFQGREEIAGIIFDYNEILDTKYYKETYDKYRMLNENIVSLNSNIKTGTKELEDTMYSIKILLNEANENFNAGLNNYKREKFEEAKDNFTRANDRYFEILSKVKEKDVERKIDATKKYIEDIDGRFYKKDMEIADKQLDNARKNFYNENYEEAKKNLDYAESLFVKYNEENETLSYYRERIASAIRIKSGTKVKSDDPAYDHIVELFKNANDSYEKGKKIGDKTLFENALSFLSQILVEKPYNEEARFLETKILKETDPANFEARFQNYYDKAMAKLDKARGSKSKLDYGEALLELQQLLKFEKSITRINSFIAESKKALEFTRKEITVVDKDYARKLVAKATDFYAKGAYKDALQSANDAIKAWDEAPEAKNIRLKAMAQLRITEASTLTTDNELKYRRAEKAYAESDYELCYTLTKEILSQKGQDTAKVINLNKKAEIQKERNK